MLGEMLWLTGIGFDYISGVKAGNQIERLIAAVKTTNKSIQKLSDFIYYAPDVQEIHHSQSRKLQDLRKINNELSFLQKAVGGNILSTAIVTTSEKIKEAFKKDPFEVLDLVRPLNRTKSHPNPDAMPVVFYDNGTKYVGRIMKGLLPAVFGIDYQKSNDLYIPKAQIHNFATPYNRREDASVLNGLVIEMELGQILTELQAGSKNFASLKAITDVDFAAGHEDFEIKLMEAKLEIQLKHVGSILVELQSIRRNSNYLATNHEIIDLPNGEVIEVQFGAIITELQSIRNCFYRLTISDQITRVPNSKIIEQQFGAIITELQLLRVVFYMLTMDNKISNITNGDAMGLIFDGIIIEIQEIKKIISKM